MGNSDWVAILGWRIQELSREVVFKTGCDRHLRRGRPCEMRGKRSASKVKNQHKRVFQGQKVAAAGVENGACSRPGCIRP